MSTRTAGFGFRRYIRSPFDLGPMGSFATSAIALGVGAVAWEAVGRIADASFFPPLSAVMARLVEMTLAGQVLPHLVTSVTNLAIGFSLGLTLGLGLGALMGAYWRVEAAFSLYVYVLLTAPTLVFAPILYAIFGLGREPIILYITLACVDIICITTMGAVQAVPRHMIEMGRSYGATDWQLFRRIILPSGTPIAMAGIRLGAGRAVKGMVNGEMFIAAVGLGALVLRAGRRFDATTVLALLMVIVITAFAVTFLVQAVDRRVTRWLPQTQRER